MIVAALAVAALPIATLAVAAGFAFGDDLGGAFMGRHGVVAGEHDADAVAVFDPLNRVPLVVHDVDDRVRRRRDTDLGAFARIGRDVLCGPQQAERIGFDAAHPAEAGAVRAFVEARLEHRRPEPLARQLDQAERTHPADMDAGPVGLQRILQLALDRLVVAPLLHVDEVDDDDAGELAQPQLARGFHRGFEVGLERRLLDVALAGRTARVHVDRDQRFRLVDHEVAAGGQPYDRIEQAFQPALDLARLEKRSGFLIGLHPLGVARHQRAHEVLGFTIGRVAFDQHLVDVAGVEVADRPFDQTRFLVDQRGRDRLEGPLADLLPQAQQEFVVALDLGLGALNAGGADDHGHAVRQVEIGNQTLQALPVLGVRDLAGDAAALAGVRHQHAVAAGERNVGRHRGALAAALFLGDLDQHDLAALDDLLDLVLTARLGPTPLPAAGLLFGRRRVLAVVVVRGIGGVRLRLFGLGAGLFVIVVGFGGGCFRVLDVVRCGRGFGFARLVRRGGRVLILDVRLVVGVVVIAAVARRAGLVRFVVVIDVQAVGSVGRRGGGERFAVRDGNAVVVGVDFVERQEAVAIAAVADERRLERRLDARYLGEIDIAFERPERRAFEIKLFKAVLADDDDARFFAVRRIDQHRFGHLGWSPGRRRRGPQGRRARAPRRRSRATGRVGRGRADMCRSRRSYRNRASANGIATKTGIGRGRSAPKQTCRLSGRFRQRARARKQAGRRVET